MDPWRVTFLSLFVLLCAALGTMVWLVRRSERIRQRRGLREWGVGLALQALSWPLFAVPPTVLGGTVQALACALLVAGHAALLRALARGQQDRGQAPAGGSLVIYLPAVLLPAAILWPGTSAAQHIGMFWAAALASLLLGLWQLATSGRAAERGNAERVVIAIYAGAGLVCALRLLEQWTRPQSGPAFDASITPAQQLALAYFLLAPVFATFAFVLSQLERQQRVLEGLAAADPLTGLDNRRAFFEQLDRRLATPAEDAGLTALLMIDVDGFKGVNDQHGHAVGDQVLRAVAGALRATLQAGDIAGRFGGDEFCLLLLDVAPGDAGRRAERLRAAVAARPVRVDGRDAAVTLSIGIAQVRGGRSADPDALLAVADRRLYLAKRAGRNRVIDRDIEVELPSRA
ncbi:GGDEF domain-containing protein [Luteimonas deserti]|uniref:diguanylate cyclase n=1 Tax=Luteimonas deserti TaxID=2752306 RepID=A0A7Z0QPM3_9GAMM|nr:GGDEF domain-containing protein [Luteimonas deserti]NYZ61425.1 GGDEF domain-containing protein [Luteimonas deserti]